MMLSPDIRRAPWSLLNHGYDALDSEEKLDAYIAAYGEMHVMKCRKALQTFPFNEIWSEDAGLFQIRKIEVFDWGCGQGLASLVFLQYLADRNLLHSVRRINLIEPSQFALNRAVSFVSQAAAPHTEIRPYCRFIPDNGENLWTDIDCAETVAVHLFSNILDIRSVGLHWLTEMTHALGNKRYYVCVGPKYGGQVSRIKDFYNYHKSAKVYSDYSVYPCGYTSDTNHPYGIEVKSFFHSASMELNGSNIEESNQGLDGTSFAGEECLKGILNDNVVEAYNVLRSAAENHFELFLQPTLGIEVPDFLLMNHSGNDATSKGVVIVNVCDDIEDFDKSYEKVEAIKAALYDTYIESLQVNTVLDRSIYNSIKTGLYFPNASEDEIKNARMNYQIKKLKEQLGPLESKLNTLKQEIRNNPAERNSRSREITNIEKFIEKIKKKIDNPHLGNPTNFLVVLTSGNAKQKLENVKCKVFPLIFYKEIKELIFPKWHPASAGDTSIVLTAMQREILSNRKEFVRVKGVAGSGKTQLLAYTAVSEHLRTGKKVLIVTFNITLRQYIYMRIMKVPMDFSTKVFNIINYHQFFLSKSKRYAGSTPFGGADDAGFFERYRAQIISNDDQYDTIIVDEAQDYESNWFDILRKYFLKPGGRFIVFGDGAQNIYERNYDTSGMPKMAGFNGRWIELPGRVSMRMLNPKIAEISSAFARSFGLTSGQLEVDSSLSLFDNSIGYCFFDRATTNQDIVSKILWILSTHDIAVADTVVLGQTVDLLRELDYIYRQATKSDTKRTFESQETYNQLTGAGNRSDNRSDNRYPIDADLKKIRRVCKVHFTTLCDCMKFATIQSFKGWESDTVILIIDAGWSSPSAQSCHAMIYTALTRARKNLFIINKGNNIYDRFFRGQILEE